MWNKKEMLYKISWLASNSIKGLETRCWDKAYRLKPISTRFQALYDLPVSTVMLLRSHEF
ncbi:MAG TPA: hypothetical protein DDW50_14985 [Firmicutes bacterium]|nr:hypothetical protein [Bacillota bacterium]